MTECRVQAVEALNLCHWHFEFVRTSSMHDGEMKSPGSCSAVTRMRMLTTCNFCNEVNLDTSRPHFTTSRCKLPYLPNDQLHCLVEVYVKLCTGKNRSIDCMADFVNASTISIYYGQQSIRLSRPESAGSKLYPEHEMFWKTELVLSQNKSCIINAIME